MEEPDSGSGSGGSSRVSRQGSSEGIPAPPDTFFVGILLLLLVVLLWTGSNFLTNFQL
jgi:hypothetical protein